VTYTLISALIVGSFDDTILSWAHVLGRRIFTRTALYYVRVRFRSMMTNVYLSLSDGTKYCKLAYIQHRWKHGIRWSRREAEEGY
jgi:hypothetical protein